MEEKRKFVRLPAPVRITYRVLKLDNIKATSISKNIGGGGIRMTVKEALKKDTFLELEISLPTRALPINAQGKVVWSIENKEEKEQKSYEVGIEFTEIGALERDAILAYVYQSRDLLKER